MRVCYVHRSVYSCVDMHLSSPDAVCRHVLSPASPHRCTHKADVAQPDNNTQKHKLSHYFACIQMSFFVVALLFTLIAINCLFLLISADGCFYCQITARPNHNMSLLGSSLDCICIPIDHCLL